MCSVLDRAVLGLLILAFSVVQYELYERHRVQVAQSDEVKTEVTACTKFVVIPSGSHDDISQCLTDCPVSRAHVGGLYRVRGLDVVRKWLRSLLLLYIREACESVRGDLPSLGLRQGRVQHMQDSLECRTGGARARSDCRSGLFVVMKINYRLLSKRMGS